MDSEQKTSIYFTDSYGMIYGTVQDNAVHKHYPLQLTVNISNGFYLYEEGVRRYVTDYAVLNSMVPHKVECPPGERVLIALVEPEQLDAVSDSRIEHVLSLLKEECDQVPQVPELAGEVGLSESRLQHLFKEYLGLSISKYSLWQRIKEAMRLVIQEGRDLTYAAHEAGFADLAHLSRMFKRYFGYSPSYFLKDSRNIQVLFQ